LILQTLIIIIYPIRHGASLSCALAQGWARARFLTAREDGTPSFSLPSL